MLLLIRCLQSELYAAIVALSTILFEQFSGLVRIRVRSSLDPMGLNTTLCTWDLGTDRTRHEPAKASAVPVGHTRPGSAVVPDRSGLPPAKLDRVSDVDLSGQVIAVTGASSGIVRQRAELSPKPAPPSPWPPAAADRIQALAERIAAGGGRAIAIATDVGEEDQARASSCAAPTPSSGGWTCSSTTPA